MSILRVTIAVVVTILWATVYMADILSKEFSAPPEISAPMLAVVTWLFGAEIKKQVQNGKNGKNGKDGSEHQDHTENVTIFH